jgi:hypothetical protein
MYESCSRVRSSRDVEDLWIAAASLPVRASWLMKFYFAQLSGETAA